MKRNKTKHTNVAVTPAQPETNSLIMTDSDGKMVKASGMQFVKDFANIADKIAQAKGGKLDDATKALLEMTEVWTPDYVPDAEEKPKRTTRKKQVDKPAKKARKTKKDETPAEEKPKRGRKKKEA